MAKQKPKTFEEQFAQHMFNGEMSLKNNWEWPTYGWCPEGHDMSDKIRFTPEMLEGITIGDIIYPESWCETCQKWYEGIYPWGVTEIPNENT